jgi:hypothetical protein
MDPIYVPVLAALAGALIGSISSIGTIYVQSKISAKRERMKQAVELAIEDHRAARAVTEILRQAGRDVDLPPLTAFLHYHEEILRAYDSGDVTPQVLRRVREKNKAVMDAFESITADARR